MILLVATQTLLPAWIKIFQCAYNTTEYPRPNIHENPYCYLNRKTKAIERAMSSLGSYHVFRLQHSLQWDDKETKCFHMLSILMITQPTLAFCLTCIYILYSILYILFSNKSHKTIDDLSDFQLQLWGE
jgi:hypothetical protein